MAKLLDLLSRGYFPKELPPPFSTEPFAVAVCFSTATLPASFEDPKLDASLCYHNLARVGTLRRRLAIPNPILHYRLCKAIQDNWAQLDTFMRGACLSRSIPIPGSWGERALVRLRNPADLILDRAEVRTTSRYLLKTDISRFYHSIYTHSIPWALHGKDYAKKHRGDPILGNIVDRHIRNSQSQQTLGIPVGPDTSLVIAELLLASIDKTLVAEIGNLRGFRYVDDYELCFESRSDAEAALDLLQVLLGHYELALNAAKTQILEFPLCLDREWASELRGFEFRPGTAAQATDLVRFFDRVAILAQENPDGSVLGYAIRRLEGETIHAKNMKLLVDLLLHCALIEPRTLPVVLRHIQHYTLLGFPVDRSKVGEVANNLIGYHAPRGQSSEVAWALWALIVSEQNITPTAAEAVSKMDDSVVALLALDAFNRGLVPSGLNTSSWQPFMDEKELYGEHWLLSYEANVKRWLSSSTGTDHVKNDPNFWYLKLKGVSFYDPSASHGAITTTVLSYEAGI